MLDAFAIRYSAVIRRDTVQLYADITGKLIRTAFKAYPSKNITNKAFIIEGKYNRQTQYWIAEDLPTESR